MIKEQIESRIQVIFNYIHAFAESLKNEEIPILTFDAEEAAKSIVTLYDRYTEEVIRPAINSDTIHHSKIAANTELAILRINPFVCETDRDAEKIINIRFAQYAAIRIILEWNESVIDNVKALEVMKNDTEVKAFLKEHIDWLRLLKPAYYYPVFSNAQVWRLFYYLLKIKIETLP